MAESNSRPDPWREPSEESVDIYPGLTVWDSRVSGSITAGRSRLPLWAFAYTVVVEGWDQAEHGWEPSQYGMTAEDFGNFLCYVLEQRGEFGRLICILADAERWERQKLKRSAWWQNRKQRKRVADQLRRCLAAIEDAA